MKLVLDRNEIESALLAWAQEKFPRIMFDTVEFDTGYSSIRSATLTHKEPEAKEEA